MTYNTETQYYKGIPIRLIIRNYTGYNAKRYTLNGTNQNVWIPNKFLREDGTLMNGRNIDFVFKRARNQCRIAGLSGIKWLGIQEVMRMKAKATIVVEVETDEPGVGIQDSIQEYFYTANKMIGNIEMELQEFVSGEEIHD